MLLRRITDHVKAQNWTAVGLDFAIVVLGVFIGLQVSNWNDARSEERRAEFLEMRLVDEFSRIEAVTARNIRSIEEWQATTQRLSQATLAGELTVAQDDLDSSLEQVGNWLQPSGTSATTNEIISQGDMDLLKSPELRSALLEYNIVAERHIDSNLVLIQSIGDDVDIVNRIQALASVRANERPTKYSEILQRDLSSPEFYLATSGILRARSIELSWHQATLERVCSVLSALEQPCSQTSGAEDGEGD